MTVTDQSASSFEKKHGSSVILKLNPSSNRFQATSVQWSNHQYLRKLYRHHLPSPVFNLRLVYRQRND